MKKHYLLLIILLVVSSGLHAQRFAIADSLPKGAYGTAAWGDYDGDGFKDLVYITQTLSPAEPNILYVYHNVAGHLVKVTQTFPGLSLPAACWGDLDNDGKDDLVVSGFGDTADVLLIYKSNGNGTFTLKNDTLSKINSGSIAIADYNNDGLQDIAISGFLSTPIVSTATQILKNTGSFSFSNIHVSLPGIYRGEIKWYDYDQDGKADLSYTGLTDTGSARVFIFHNDGNDAFHQVNGYMRGAIDGTVDWIDYNGDGRKDLVITGTDSIGASIFTDLYKNNGDGSFPSVTTNLIPFGEPSAADVADFNNDGKPDMCLIGGSAVLPNPGAVFLNDGTATFTQEVLAFPHIDIFTNCVVAAADIDNDGDQDLLCAHYILKNKGGGLDIRERVLEQVAIYPNPASGFLNINNPLQELHITLTDISGRTLLRRKMGKGTHTIGIGHCAAGVYELLLSTGKNEELRKKVTVYQ